jgi:hypothetical protein
MVSIVMACSPLKVQHDYDTAYDFAKLKTYEWAASPPGSEKEELTMRRIEQTVNSQLQTKGYVRSGETPDFLVSVQGVRKTVTGGSVGVGTSIAVPVGSRGSMSVGLGKSKSRSHEEGTLILEFMDAAAKKLIWQGTASATLRESATPEEQQQRINAVVAELLKKFPPAGK